MDVVVELGCHTGLLTRFYALARPRAQIVGIDVNHAAIEVGHEQARQRGIENVTFEVRDFRRDGKTLYLWRIVS